MSLNGMVHPKILLLKPKFWVIYLTLFFFFSHMRMSKWWQNVLFLVKLFKLWSKKQKKMIRMIEWAFERQQTEKKTTNKQRGKTELKTGFEQTFYKHSENEGWINTDWTLTKRPICLQPSSAITFSLWYAELRVMVVVKKTPENEHFVIIYSPSRCFS